MQKYYSLMSLLVQAAIQTQLQGKPIWLHLTPNISPLNQNIKYNCSVLNDWYTFTPRKGYLNIIAVLHNSEDAMHLESKYEDVIVYVLN